jgi:hypothetical protein
LIEEKALARELDKNPSLKPGEISPLVYHRPLVLTCPSGYEGESLIPKVPTAHYMGFFSDVHYGYRQPWLVSQESVSGADKNAGPHSGGYNVADSRDAVLWRERP